MNNQNVPFLDLITPHVEREEEFVSIFREALKTGRFIGGPNVETFEKNFAEFCGAKYCIGVGSGTDAVRFALIAAGVKPGEIVITVANTFIATTEGITQSGAEHRFIDVDEKTYNMDINRLKEFLESCDIDRKTGRPVERKSGKVVSAILPVHLYGQVADMDPLLEFAEKYNLMVIEDACQAHGAEYVSKNEGKSLKAGSLGKAAAFSFYPGKNLGAFGEGGAVTTDDEAVAKKIRMLRDHGQSQKYYHDIEGYNGRLDSIQAGILGIKLQSLREQNEKRRAAALRYQELLKGCREVILPYEPAWSKAVYHLYIIRVDKRDDLQKFLSQNGISTGLHYPVPLHRQKAYSGNGSHGDLKVTDRVAGEILSLPMFPGLTESQQKYVSGKIIEFFDVHAK